MPASCWRRLTKACFWEAQRGLEVWPAPALEDLERARLCRSGAINLIRGLSRPWAGLEWWTGNTSGNLVVAALISIPFSAHLLSFPLCGGKARSTGSAFASACPPSRVLPLTRCWATRAQGTLDPRREG